MSDEDDVPLQALRQDVEEIKETLNDNRKKILEREGKLNELEARADNLQDAADNFNKVAKEVKQKKLWENRKTKIMIGGFISLIVLILIIILLCKFLPNDGTS